MAANEVTPQARELARARKKKWRLANSDKIRAYNAKRDPETQQTRGARYYAAHAEKERAASAAYRKANPEKVKAANKAWSEANADKIRERSAIYRKENADRLREYYRGRKPQMAANAKQFRENPANRMTILANTARARAKRMGLECDGLKELRRASIPATCACCHCALDCSRKKRDRSPTLDRHDTGKGYVIGNIRVICHRCNRLKSDATIKELEAILAYMRG